MTAYLILDSQLRSETDAEVIATLRRKGWQDAPAKPSDDASWQDGAWVVPPAPTFTAEQHLESNGYGPLRLVALLDLEAKLAAANKSSAAMSAARAWIDGILAAYATDPSPRSDWPVPPVAFEVAVAEAVGTLTS